MTEEINGMSSNEPLNDKDLIALMDVYSKEWIHRDSLFWVQIFKFFYATLIVTIIPNLENSSWFNFSSVPRCLFRVIALLMSGLFLYLGLAAGKRLEAIRDTYGDLSKKLKPGYNKYEIKDLHFKLFGHDIPVFGCHTSKLIVYTMFLLLVLVNFILMGYS